MSSWPCSDTLVSGLGLRFTFSQLLEETGNAIDAFTENEAILFPQRSFGLVDGDDCLQSLSSMVSPLPRQRAKPPTVQPIILTTGYST